ncbi:MULTISPECIES: YcnI family protein [unclassified Streptomyces]|uniref:YcnI family copper-binding membrane protein n=1 Tax=unclassified Streptomyces TaxID=2593676 RepID=UPI00190893B3|nr:YcnI family protein [Streptomyces sp. HSG2]
MKASRTTAVGAVTGAAVLFLSGPAWAHVTVEPEGSAARGGYATVNFKVPNERDDSSTTKLEVTFPAAHPLSSVLPAPVPGWTTEVTESPLDEPVEAHGRKLTRAVTKVTWTADGDGIESGFFQSFPVSLGALPDDADRLVFKAIQTYSDDEVVRWIEVPEAGDDEPANPAPVLELTAAEDGHHGGGAETTETTAATPSSPAEDTTRDTTLAATQAPGTDDTGALADSGGTDTTARVLGVVGIAVGAAGVAYGVLSGRRRGQA